MMIPVQPASRPARVAGMLLAAAAGAVDAVALLHLGGAFASVVTGNLVLVGVGAATLDAARLLPPAVAVVGFAAGVAGCGLAWRRAARPRTGPLVAELVLLCAALAAVLLDAPAPVVLVALAAAMGAQSVVGLDLGKATTYMTGALTTTLHAVTTGEGRARGAVGQLAALVTGAAAAGLLAAVTPAVALVLPVILTAAALAPVAVTRRR